MTVRTDNHSQLIHNLKGISFYLVLLFVVGLLAFVTHNNSIELDWTGGKRNTLSAASIKLLETLDQPIHATVYATEDESVRRTIKNTLDRYRRVYPDFDTQYINPDLEPAQVRELNIMRNGEIVLSYAGRTEKVAFASEQNITNAIQRLARSNDRWLVFLSGHGERKPQGEANHYLSAWAKQLEAKGFKAQEHNLAENPQLPDNTAVLVIASPQVDLLPGEVAIIQQYVEQGGQLLWFHDPGPLFQLEPLAQELGIQFSDGTIVDPTTQVFGINDPRFAIVTSYPGHPITESFEVVTLYPQARGITIDEDSQWQTTPLMVSLDRSWAETGEMKGNIGFDKDTDLKGPLIVGLALQRKHPNTNNAQQRVFVVGDGDFLSNAYLGNAGNMDLGLSIVNWLSHDDRFLSIPVKTAPDVRLELNKTQQIVIAFGFLFVIPTLLTGSGLFIWFRRRKR